MNKFASLLNQLYFTHSHLGKMALLKDFFATTLDPERGLALAIIANDLSFPHFKKALIKDLILTRVDPVLFEMSYDYVGDLAETVALMWPEKPLTSKGTLPSLSQFLTDISTLDKSNLLIYLTKLLDVASATERWAILKLGTGEMRIGVSKRFLKLALAAYGDKDIHEIEQIWHGIQSPYLELFNWLDNKHDKPDMKENVYFHPVMLANPLAEEDINKIDPKLFAIEKKFDGIRVQLVMTSRGKAIYSRTGDDISTAFPDALESLNTSVVLDGELVIKPDHALGSFNDLQQRLNRKTPSKKLLLSSPAHVILYDILSCENKDVRSLPFVTRRKVLQDWYHTHPLPNMSLSHLLPYESICQLRDIRMAVIEERHIAIEGLMLKRKDSPYLPGRPQGQWYKWKRDPLVIDAVVMYAQRGHGKRSSFYSDFTFGLWENNELLPIGKAYSGFTDEELNMLDKWVRQNIIKSFGPVREVNKSLVFEVAFDAVNLSKRHRSGVALRFPRVHRIRWDKPANEADQLDNLKKLIK